MNEVCILYLEWNFLEMALAAQISFHFVRALNEVVSKLRKSVWVGLIMC